MAHSARHSRPADPRRDAAAALEFLILTTARTGEVIGSRRPEIDFAARMWRIFLAVPKGRNALIFGLGNRCSSRLSYGTVEFFQIDSEAATCSSLIIASCDGMAAELP